MVTNRIQNRQLPAIILLAALFAVNIQLSAVQYPVEPVVPDLEDASAESESAPVNQKSSANPGKEIIELKSFQVTAVLQSSDELHGRIELPVSFTFKHHMNGHNFEKTLSSDQIASIAFTGYQAELVKEDAEGKLYAFSPSRIIVRLKNNEVYEPYSPLPFLKKIKIKTRYGTTVLFPEFADLWHKESGWSEVKSTDPEYHVTRAHPKSVVEIRMYTKSGN